MTYYSRAEWGARNREAAYHFGGSDVDGIALHWPAMRTRRTSPAAVKRALRGWQRYHMDTNGWSDIAYQEAIDQGGNVYELRGLTHKPGANGNSSLNARFGALLLVLAPGEQPTDALMDAARDRIARFRDLHPTGTRIVGHGDIRPGGTQCPGPIAQHLINAGAFEPGTPTSEEDDMTPQQAEQLDWLYKRVKGITKQRYVGEGDDRRPAHLLDERDGDYLRRQIVAGRIDPDALATAVAAAIGSAEVDESRLAAEIIRQLTTQPEE